ncbi:MAG: RNA 3'-terminal phosphate cyclase [Candidatus Diapherotrites archaeon]|nr:RNA 3'-terminal phosphate cyclase [Candidatus Diapherotrites archaeon]
MIEVDASAGGQVLRTSIALSALLGKKTRVFNIRKNRPRAGLFAQHLTGLKSLAALCGAQLKGDFIGSTEIIFSPQEFKPQSLNISIGTAGSVTLLLQSLLLPCFLDETRLRISGGTDVLFAPSFHYFNEVFRPALSIFGAKFDLNLINYGFYPQGGGSISFKSHKIKKLKPIYITEKKGLFAIKIFSHSSNLPSHVAKTQALSAKRALEQLNVEFAEKIGVVEGSASTGSAIDLIACFKGGFCFGANAIGRHGKPAQAVGREAAKNLLEELNSGAAMDSHLADQLLPFMALAGGKSRILCVCETEHVKSNIEVIEKFLDVAFEKELKGNCLEISVKGAGFF